MFAKSIKTGQLLVAVAAAMSNPTSIFIGRAALTALSLLSDELSERNPALLKLAAEIERDFNRELAKPAYDKPADTRQLLPQMLEISAARMEFAEHGLDAGRILDDLIDRLDSPDYRPEHIRAFRRLLAPILADICNDPRLKQALDPALTRLQMQRQQEQSSQIEAILARLGGIEHALEAPAALAPADLAALAARFGAPAGAGHATLIEFLTDKADEYRLYRDQIDSLDERISAVAALKSQALGAAEKLDFDAVEDILAAVTNTEATLFAETTLARAQNALMRGRAEQAFSLLSAAADSFGAVSPAEPPRRRNHHAGLLLAHGQRYGGPALMLAAEMLDTAAAQARATDQPALLSACLQNRAIALHNQARFSAGSEAIALLDEAVAVFETALAGLDPELRPEDWATAQQNLGAALSTLGGRTAGDAGIAHLARTVSAFEAALGMRSRADDPRDWSRLQQNLGVALKAWGERLSGEAASVAMVRSVAAFETALGAISPQDDADDWATIQLNLGNALTAQAELAEDALRIALLARAESCFENALAVYTRRDHPMDWASLQINLGNARALRAASGDGPDAAAAFAGAEAAYHAALDAYDEAEHPMLWAMAEENLACLHDDRARRGGAEAGAHLQAALGHVENALRIYDPDHSSQDYQSAARLRDDIRARLASTG